VPSLTEVTAADGVPVAVHDLGGSGPPLLLAHATGFCGMVFAPLGEHLADSYRCLALDERGHGDSGVPADLRFDWSGFGLDVLAAVDGLGLEGAFAVGHSCGGAALLLAEQARPGTFSGLYLYEPILVAAGEVGAAPAGVDNPLAEGARRRREVFSSRDEAYQRFSSRPPLSSLSPAALRAYVDHGLEDLPDGTVRLKCRGEHEARVFSMAPFNGAIDRLDQVGCPVTVVQGETTDTFGPAFAEGIAARLPRGRAVVMKGLGHLGPLEDPAAVAASVRQALGPHPLPAS
jgi:pimeloyl-ACP methyl ester carboxylesterase